MNSDKGFSLTELMTVIAIIGILAAVAYPSYQNHLRKGRRAEAQTLMMEIANRQQQFLMDARQYTTTMGAGGLNISTSGWTCAATCTNPFYSVSVPAVGATPPSYTITAAAQGVQLADGDLTLNSDGSKTRAGQPGW